MLKPCGNRVIVLAEEKDERTQGGIIIPKGSQSRNELIPAKVLAIGPEVEELDVNDVVLIDEYVGKPVRLGDVEVLIIDADRVYCVVEE